MPSITPRADTPPPPESSSTSQNDNPPSETASSKPAGAVGPGPGSVTASSSQDAPSGTSDTSPISKSKTGDTGSPVSSDTPSTVPQSSPASPSQPSTTPAITSPTTTASTSATSATSVMSSTSADAISANNATSSPEKSSHSSSGSSSISSGALAGGIIGAFAIGILLALMAAYLFNKQKHRKEKRGSGDPRGSVARQYKGTAYEKVPESGLAASSWERYLPQSIDDQSMKASVQSLVNQITVHVDNFYARSDVAINASVTENLARMDTGLLLGPLPAVMTEPKMQLLAIKHCIARIVTTRMLPGSDIDTTLLPPHLAAVPEKLQPDIESGKETPATRQAYCQWKMLTSYLYPKAETSTTMLAQQRNASMAIIKSVTAAFSHWETKPTEGPSAAENLAQIIDVARGVSATIMSQASSFDWRWRLSPRQHGTEPLDHFVVYPGFVKITDDKGRTLERAQTLVRPLMQESRGDA